MKRFFELLVLVYINGHDRAKNLFLHCFKMRIGCFYYRRLDKITFCFIAGSTEDYLSIGRFFCKINIAHDVVERGFIDDRIHKVTEFTNIANSYASDHLTNPRFHFGPHRLRNVGT